MNRLEHFSGNAAIHCHPNGPQPGHSDFSKVYPAGYHELHKNAPSEIVHEHTPLHNAIWEMHGQTAEHWKNVLPTDLPSEMLRMHLDESQKKLALEGFALISQYMRNDATSNAYKAVEMSNFLQKWHDRLPMAAVLSGSGGFDPYIDGLVPRSGGGIRKDAHFKPNQVELDRHATARQTARFVTLCRRLKINSMIAYEPLYSKVDLVILAAFHIHAFGRDDPQYGPLRWFKVPTFFYAPAGNYEPSHSALARSVNCPVIYLGPSIGAFWAASSKLFSAFAKNSETFLITSDHEAENECEEVLQIIPTAKFSAYKSEAQLAIRDIKNNGLSPELFEDCSKARLLDPTGHPRSGNEQFLPSNRVVTFWH